MAAAYAKELLGCVELSLVDAEDSAESIFEHKIDCVQQTTATTKAARWDEAEKLLVQVTETRKTKLGADHPDTLTSMGDLASMYKSQGRLEEAEKLDMQVRKIRWQILGSGRLNVLDVSSEPVEYD
ncbi:hypothetical protein PENCOP_c001G02912 [Penicillium coprophilum]|uniref:Kinesin light chain n=1 Tax=Penicillium coprophilum TaxID=36646 RepID=A0A1V6V651_9EURO|nr:hypothetical protein PENCOP_c001G02912 [Penicillium coprophilum]